MSFDTDTRNRLAHFVATCRKHLCGDYQSPGGEMVRQLAHFGIQANGDTLDLDTLDHLSEHEREQAQTLRDILDHKRANSPATKTWKKFDPTVYDLIQEQGFTALNRLCALRMAEERKILAYPCLSKGHQSDAFQLYEMRSGKNVDSVGPEERYELFLFSLFDELSLDLGALFDRRNAEGLLFPAPAALTQLLEEINDPALAPLWAEDETIGWIYQYWNSKEERKAMRDASAAPRNSRELAVRNQFFTPRYVVEFLTDNTLGRIWYEMTKGQTRLTEQCRYLVRRPTEIFLGEDEDAPDPPEGDTEETLSQEELLKQPVHIPHRPVKDPREIRLLDPACGSMHFGLYAFDLFEAIYEEAWDKGLCPALQKAYSKKEDYLRDVPRLIIEHNIHGVDIDPRAVQIAGLSLWLRAQKTWKDTPAAERPRVRRSNIVCAEPMPGSDAMLEDFVQTLGTPLLGELVKSVFDKMQLAGEAGTLLKIEEEIRTAIDDAKAKWEKLGAADRDLFSAEELNQTLRPGTQQELTGVEKALTTDHRPLATDFFDTAEERIYAALRDYAESAEAGDYQRRLFAEDAAHGFAFIDLCRKRYDAVVMNPPFGAACRSTKSLFARSYFIGRSDLYACMILRALEMLTQNGLTGAITARTGFFLQSFSEWRSQLLGITQVSCFADLGGDVLDAAMVETASYVLGTSNQNLTPFFRIDTDEKGEPLLNAIERVAAGHRDPCLHLSDTKSFKDFPDQAWSYWISSEMAKMFRNHNAFEPAVGEIRIGVQTNDDFRFVRTWWEAPTHLIGKSANDSNDGKGWVAFLKGGDASKHFAEIAMLLNWFEEGRELKAFSTLVEKGGHWSRNIRSVDRYFLPGISWTKRSATFDPHLVPPGCIPSVSRYLALSDNVKLTTILSAWNTKFFDSLVKLRMENWAAPIYSIGIIKDLPFPEFKDDQQRILADSSTEIWRLKLSVSSSEETSRYSMPTITTRGQASLAKVAAEHSSENRRIIERICNRVLEADLSVLDFLSRSNLAEITEGSKLGDSSPEIEDPQASPIQRSCVESVLSNTIGHILGRWDIRYATGERQPPELPDPFDPLPVCPPGMLQNADGLPAAPADVPDDYPLRITWPGIVVSDPGHPEDIVARVRDALAVIWGERSAAIEQEACEILGVRTLRDYFAEKKSGGKFFKDHLKRYSKSRRQAPIYWPLSTESGTYTLWIYYHRLTEDTLYACITNFVAPKQEEVEEDFKKLHDKGDARTKAEDKEYEQTEALIGELATFRAELERLAKIWKPNLNDGVQITASPLWSLFRLKPWQKKLKDTWQKLENGDYDWAHQAHTLWPERVIPKCATDRSLAIAHGYEQDLWEEVKNAKGKLVWQPKKNADETVQKLINNA